MKTLKQLHKDWKLTEIKFLKQNLHKTDKELAEALGRTAGSVQRARHRHNIMKPKESGYFKKGQSPLNKGKKQSEWMNEDAINKTTSTRFRKGNKPPKVRAMGEVFQMRGNDGKVALYIKLPESKQYSYGRYLWEQHHNCKLTKDDIIRFCDGNSLNCTIDNLMKVSRKENALMNVNRAKAAESLKGIWAVVRTFEDFGITPPYKFKTKRKTNAA